MNLVNGLPKLRHVDEGPNGERLEKYPYSPDDAARVHELHGLDKLRGIEDPELRRMLFNMYWHSQRLAQSPQWQAAERARKERERTAELNRRKLFVLDALEGKLGPDLQVYAREEAPTRDVATMTEHTIQDLYDRIRRGEI